MPNNIDSAKLNTSPPEVTAILRRGLDVCAAGLGLLLLTPLLAFVALVIKLTSRGPVFYRAERVGQNGQLFRLYKFRSMVSGADRQGPGITTQGDARITRIGRIVRRAKLDELPQLINVLRGEMSLVGPRPEDPRYVALYTPNQRQLLAVQPGITSPASLHYRREEELLTGPNWEQVYCAQILPRKLELELEYQNRRTLWTDLGFILRTVAALLPRWQFPRPPAQLRNRHLFALDVLALLLIPALALTLRLDRLNWWSDTGLALTLYTAAALLVQLPIFYGVGLYRRYWRYAGVNDLTLIAIAVGMSTLIMFAAVLITQPLLAGFRLACPRTVPLIAGLLTGLAVGGLRLGVRGLYQWGQRQSPPGGRRVLIVGAGEAGAMAAREMRANPQLNLEPVAFVDDDPEKHGVHIHGLPVLGGCPDIPRLVRQYRFQRIIVAVPSMSRPRRQEILALCAQTGLPTDSLPGIYELLAGSKAISALPPVDIHRLLRRPPIFTDTTDIAATVAGQTVLVTGAGGSIGSELCRQVARMKPKCLILLGRGENSIFEITLDLRLSFPHLTTRPVILDVRNAAEVAWVVEEYRPGLIFHAAAHKHVPFMEGNAKEAVTNNILGTYNVLAAAEQYGVPRLVMISTDKAVNPTSIMGATKRLAELLVMAAARRTGRAYMAVRFGNVLGSRGSVIPVFQRQIAAGGPVTVTHPDMTRYFMTIPEAVQLVLQAPVLGSGGEVFVLDMGKPVRILDLATDLVKLAGFEVGRDIEIAFSGIRPGEKIYEELFLDGEEYRRTCHAKIFRAIQTGSMPAEAAGQMVMELVGLARQIKDRDANEQMRILIPNICFYVDKYQPCGCKPAPTPPAEVTPSTLQPAISRQWSVVSR